MNGVHASERLGYKSLHIARAQLRLGAIGYLGLLTTENIYDTALLARV